MIRLTRLADYAVVLLSHMARVPQQRFNAAALAEATGVPAPTVGKLLGLMSRGGLLSSTRGQAGGYQMALKAEDITMADIIAVIDGPIAITDCMDDDGDDCVIESFCGTKATWARVNTAIHDALSKVTLAEILEDQMAPFVAMAEAPAQKEVRR